MGKRFFTIITAAAALNCFAALEIFFVPGWRTGFSSRQGCVRILKKIYPDATITVKSWDSAVSYSLAKKNAGIYQETLLKEILEMPAERRKNLVLIGHSIGAAIVMHSMKTLRAKNLKIYELVLLGAAFPADDPEIGLSTEAVRTQVFNVYSSKDALLRILYPLFEGDMPLGSTGYPVGIKKFFQTDKAGSLLGYSSHFAYLYLLEFAKLRAYVNPSVPASGLPCDPALTPCKVYENDFFWRDIERHRDLTLQQHIFENRMRITDDCRNLRASGTSENMKKLFFSLK